MLDKKIKLLLVAPVPPPYGGIANWVVLMKNYLSLKTEVDLVDIINTAPVKRGIDGRTIFDRVVIQGFNMMHQKKELQKCITSYDPTVVHITTSGQLAIIRDILLLKLLRKKNIRSIYHIHFGRIPNIAKKNTLEWKMLKKAASMSELVVAIDLKTRDVLEKEIPRKKIEYIPNPFVMKNIEKYEKTRDTKTIMFLGWCIKTKGVEELLSAWENIAYKYPEWSLKIVGPYDNNYKEQLEKKYISKSIIFEGEKSHEVALKLLSQSEIFILPSYTEGFPNVILEAMALGKSIVATDVGAIPQMLEEESGIVIKSHSVSEIEVALIKLMDNESLRKHLGRNAYNRIKTQYDIEVLYQNYLSIWKE